MTDEFLPFSRPSVGDEEIAAVVEVLRSGWITAGPRTAAFEKAFAEHMGSPHAIAVTSGTAAFHLLLHALRIGPGDEVITPSLTWPSPVNMVHLAGARPVFADIDPRTFQLDPGSVEAAVTERTRAVIPVHFGGQPCDLDRLREICRSRGAILIEDAAHAAGAGHRGTRIGGGGNPCVFSFHAIKNLTTGEGGMVTTADDELRDRLTSLRFHGVNQDAWARHGGAVVPGYDMDLPGWKANLTDIQAALGLVQLRRLGGMIARRAELARLYGELLAGVPGIERPAIVPWPSRHAWHLYPILAPGPGAGPSRDELRAALRARGIGTGLHFLAVHRLSFYRKAYPVPAGALPATEDVAGRILSLPLYPDMRDADVERVVAALREILGGGPRA